MHSTGELPIWRESAVIQRCGLDSLYITNWDFGYSSVPSPLPFHDVHAAIVRFIEPVGVNGIKIDRPYGIGDMLGAHVLAAEEVADEDLCGWSSPGRPTARRKCAVTAGALSEIEPQPYPNDTQTQLCQRYHMAPWHDGLEGVHRAIAEEPNTPLHVLAGPGTGKTFAMMRRIARLLEEGTPPEAILAVSFTRTAARDLTEQLSRLGVTGAGRVRASTLHSLCFSILNDAEVFAHTQRIPRPLLSYEVRALEQDLRGSFGGIRQVRRLLAAYEAAWARLQTDEPGGPSAELDATFHRAIVEWLRLHRAMLVGELVPLTLAFVRQNPAFDALPRFEHVLVDEYQDLNRAEQELIDHLASNGALTVIGDDCQSVYSFRHANPEGIRTFPASRDGVVCATIEQCRRCPPNFVRMSNELISNDPDRSRQVPLTPYGDRPHATVYIVQHATLQAEVAATAAL